MLGTAANGLLQEREAGVSFPYNSRWFYDEDTRHIAFARCAAMSALWMQGCPSFPPAGFS